MRRTAPAVLAAILTATASASPPAAWTNGHWYQIVEAPCLGWHEARAAAEAAGGHLATIGSIEEHQFIRDLSPYFAVWIGLYQDRTAPDFSEPAGGWRWVTGEPLAFTVSRRCGFVDRLHQRFLFELAGWAPGDAGAWCGWRSGTRGPAFPKRRRTTSSRSSTG